jgi:hypothetical protein
MGDMDCKELDVVDITSLNFLLPFGYSYSKVLSFYRDHARRINNLYLSNDKELITSYFVGEMERTELSRYDVEDAKVELFSYDLEQLKEKLVLCANLVYRFYLLKKTGYSTTESYSPKKILDLIYK